MQPEKFENAREKAIKDGWNPVFLGRTAADGLRLAVLENGPHSRFIVADTVSTSDAVADHVPEHTHTLRERHRPNIDLDAVLIEDLETFADSPIKQKLLDDHHRTVAEMQEEGMSEKEMKIIGMKVPHALSAQKDNFDGYKVEDVEVLPIDKDDNVIISPRRYERDQKEASDIEYAANDAASNVGGVFRKKERRQQAYREVIDHYKNTSRPPSA